MAVTPSGLTLPGVKLGHCCFHSFRRLRFAPQQIPKRPWRDARDPWLCCFAASPPSTARCSRLGRRIRKGTREKVAGCFRSMALLFFRAGAAERTLSIIRSFGGPGLFEPEFNPDLAPASAPASICPAYRRRAIEGVRPRNIPNDDEARIPSFRRAGRDCGEGYKIGAGARHGGGCSQRARHRRGRVHLRPADRDELRRHVPIRGRSRFGAIQGPVQSGRQRARRVHLQGYGGRHAQRRHALLVVSMDLRAEPLILSVPAVDRNRYYSVQLCDGNTYNYGYVGSRITGNDAGDYMVCRAGLERIGSRGRQEGLPLEHKVFARHLSHPALQSRRYRQCDQGSGRLQGSAALRLSQTACAARLRRPSTSPSSTRISPRPSSLNTSTSRLRSRRLGPTKSTSAPSFATIGVGPGKTFNFKDLSAEDKREIVLGVKEGARKVEEAIANAGTNVNGWRVGGLAEATAPFTTATGSSAPRSREPESTPTTPPKRATRPPAATATGSRSTAVSMTTR